MINKTLIIYHQIKPGVDCPDGIAAAWVALRKYPEAKLMGCSYGEPCPKISGYERVVVVDFSFARVILEGWAALTDLLVIDHHKTAMADLSGFSNAIFDTKESGASLAWKTFFPDEPIPPFIAHVKDRDLWNFNLKATKEIHEATAFMGRKIRQLDWYCSLTEEQLQQGIAPLGALLLEPKRQRIRELAETAVSGHVLGHSALIVDVPPTDARLVSDLCSYLYGSNSDYDLICTCTPDEKTEGKINLSFRSDKNGGNFDVSAVAKKLNGGGHHNAAGGWCLVSEMTRVFGGGANGQ